MNVVAKIAGKVRGLVAWDEPENREDGQIAVNGRQDLLVAQSLPELTEIVRMGGSYAAMSAVAAAVTAVPTTTAGYTLYNGETGADAECYAIDSLGCIEVVTDATQQNSLALMAMMSKGTITAPTADASVLACLSGRAGTPSGSKRALAVGSLTDDGWIPHGPSAPGATAFAGGVWRVHEAPVRGLYLVRPGGGFHIVAVKTVATASQIRYFVRWHQVKVKYKA